MNYLKMRNDIDTNQIGLIWDSEGVLIAAMVAVKVQNKVAFTVSLAGPGVTGDQIIFSQYKKLDKRSRGEKATNYGIEQIRKGFELMICKLKKQSELIPALENLIDIAIKEVSNIVQRFINR